VRLSLQRRGQPVHGRQQVVGDLVQRRQVDGRRENVVRRLAHVDVVVGVNPVAREVGDHLVGVHVRGGARAGLEDVDRELIVVLAGSHGRRGSGHATGDLAVEQAELTVDLGGGGLDAPQPPDHGHGDPLARDDEVGHRLARLLAPELGVNVDRSHWSVRGCF
jgi:hypothetical protein